VAAEMKMQLHYSNTLQRNEVFGLYGNNMHCKQV